MRYGILALLLACADKTDDSAVDTGPFDHDNDGFVMSEDCDDYDASVNPVAAEVCDGVDQNCDGEADEGATDADTWCYDADLDGYGGDEGCTVSCTQPEEGYVPNGDDCLDIDARVNPEGVEVCDAGDVDEDCNGSYDDNDAGLADADKYLWYPDADADGYGDENDPGTALCNDPSTTADRYVDNNWDCNDDSRRYAPYEDEDMDGVDNDCDDRIDETGRDGVTAYHYAFDTDPDAWYCELLFVSDWSWQTDDCVDCDWTFNVKLTMDETNSTGVDACWSGDTEIWWSVGFDADYPAGPMLWYYFDAYNAWYPIFNASFDEETDHLAFQSGFYQYPYYGYYYTNGWIGEATVVVY